MNSGEGSRLFEGVYIALWHNVVSTKKYVREMRRLGGDGRRRVVRVYPRIARQGIALVSLHTEVELLPLPDPEVEESTRFFFPGPRCFCL
jgi:hypothetical protein